MKRKGEKSYDCGRVLTLVKTFDEGRHESINALASSWTVHRVRRTSMA